MRCPCCDGTGQIDPGPPVRLTRTQTRIYFEVRKCPHGIPIRELAERIFRHREDGGPLCWNDVIRSTVYKMNLRLAPVREKIRTEAGVYKLFHAATSFQMRGP